MATGSGRGSRAISDEATPPAKPPPAKPPRRSVAGRLVARAFLAVALICGGLAAVVLSDLDAYWPLDLREPPGAFTQARIRLLANQPETCLKVLRRSGFKPTRATPVRSGERGCGFEDGVRISGGALDGTPVMRCAAAAAYGTWMRHVVEPAATGILGSRLTSVRTLGTYSCRDIAGRPGRRSQHASANAIDIAGFRLADGRVLTLSRDWSDEGPAGRFLRGVRDGACGLFAGVLSPDWNRAHADHFHFDMGRLEICR